MELPDCREMLLRKPKGQPIYEVHDAFLQESRRVIEEIHARVLPPAWSLECDEQRVFSSVHIVQGDLRQNMGELLAPGYSFSRVDPNTRRSAIGQEVHNIMNTAVCDKVERTVTVSPYDMHIAEALPTLLHEIGHSHQRLPDPLIRSRCDDFRWYATFIWALRRREIRRSTWLQVHSTLHRGSLDYGMRMDPGWFYPASISEPTHREAAVFENDANRRAHVMMHQLSGEGFSVFDCFPGDTLVDLENVGLNTYEANRWLEIYARDGKRALERAEPLYLRQKE